MNSISILRRQPSSSKLETCFCDGTEDFDCVAIKTNMAELCFRPDDDDILDNDIDVDHKSSTKLSGSLRAKLDRYLVIFTLFATLIINWVGATFSTMVNTVLTDLRADDQPAPPPEEIGLGSH